jgi:thiol-disulfide isomerase/thioredoxin
MKRPLKATMRRLSAAGLLVLAVMAALLSACGQTPVLGDINDSASIILMSCETFDDGYDGIVYRQVNRLSALLAQSDDPVLVVFYSPLAPVNTQIIPRLEQLAYDEQDRLKVVWVDASAEPALAESFSVETLPQFTVVIAGAVKRSLIGYDDEGASKLAELLAPYLSGS